MILGFLLVGFVAAIIACVLAVMAGASLVMAAVVYTLTGAVCVALLIAGQAMWRGVTGRHRPMDPAATDSTAPVRNPVMRILAVDDDPFILNLLRTIVAEKRVGTITTATSAAEALDMLADPHATYDYLLLDIRMPDVSGTALCAQIRQMPRYATTPITMLTAVRDIAHMGEAFRLGADDYVTKPFDVADLGSRLRAAQAAYAVEGQDIALPPPVAPVRDRRLASAAAAVPRHDLRSLIDAAALSNYLAQLPRKDLPQVQLFAIGCDLTDALTAAAPTEQIAQHLHAIAAVTARSLGADSTVMAYTADADLLVATYAPDQLAPLVLERQIERHLRTALPARAQSGIGDVVVSVGAAVPLARGQRMAIATDRAIRLARDRALDKQGRPVLAAFQR